MTAALVVRVACVSFAPAFNGASVTWRGFVLRGSCGRRFVCSKRCKRLLLAPSTVCLTCYNTCFLSGCLVFSPQGPLAVSLVGVVCHQGGSEEPGCVGGLVEVCLFTRWGFSDGCI